MFFSYYFDNETHKLYYAVDKTELKSEERVGYMVGQDCYWESIVTSDIIGEKYRGFGYYWTDKMKNFTVYREDKNKNKLKHEMKLESEKPEIKGVDNLIIDFSTNDSGTYVFRCSADW